jgi:hypothetical protein
LSDIPHNEMKYIVEMVADLVSMSIALYMGNLDLSEPEMQVKNTKKLKNIFKLFFSITKYFLFTFF